MHDDPTAPIDLGGARVFGATFPRVQAWTARFKLRACRSVGASPQVTGRLWIHGEGEVRIGDRVFFDAAAAPIELYPWKGAVIVIGDDTYVGGGTSFEATASIEVGARVRLGGFSRIMDNHFHPLVGDRNLRPASRPVVIEDDVALGPRTIVLAGAHIRRGTIAPAGSIINRPRNERSS